MLILLLMFCKDVAAVTKPANAVIQSPDVEHQPGDSGIPEIITIPAGGETGAVTPVKPKEFVFPEYENTAFKTGERLKFSIRYLLVPAGSAVLTVEDGKKFNGRDTYKITSVAKSMLLFFYRVRDSIVSFMDKRGLFSWRFEKEQREGLYENKDIVNFYHKQKTAERFDKTNKRSVFAIEPFMNDILSSFYYVRTKKLDVGKQLVLQVNDGRKNYDLTVRVIRRETINVPAGKFECLMLEPLLNGPGIFRNKGKVFIWVTDDERKMPVLMSSKIIIGSIYAVLTDYSLNK